MYNQENHALEPKRKLSSADTAQLAFSAITLINSAYLLHHHRSTQACSHYEIFMYFLFFGSLIWLIYLLMTIVVQFRNKGMELLLSSMDWIFIGFHLIMFIWANVLYWHYSNSCSKMWDFWVLIYLIFGYIAFFCILAVVFMGLMRKTNKRKLVREDPQFDDLDKQPTYVENEGILEDEYIPAY